MTGQPPGEAMRLLERAAPVEQWTMLCFLAGRSVDLDAGELKGAVRRAELLLAAGGDPHRALELYGRATTAVADDLDSPERRRQLRAGLEEIQQEASGLPAAGEAFRLLLADEELAWQCFALALLADELSDT
jgi:hypothetical protein